MSEYQKQKLKDKRMETHDFIIEQQDEKGVRHRFFDFKKFNTFIEEEEETVRGIHNEGNSQSINTTKRHERLSSMKPSSDYQFGNVAQGFSGISTASLTQMVPQKRLISPEPQMAKTHNTSLSNPKNSSQLHSSSAGRKRDQKDQDKLSKGGTAAPSKKSKY